MQFKLLLIKFIGTLTDQKSQSNQGLADLLLQSPVVGNNLQTSLYGKSPHIHIQTTDNILTPLLTHHQQQASNNSGT